jgi:hypothetical protein
MSAEVAPEPVAPAEGLQSEQKRPRPLDSLTAASKRLTRTTIDRFAKAAKDDARHAEARYMFRNVGELRFITSLLANQTGKVKFYVGRLSDDPLADPEPIPNPVDGVPDDQEAPSTDDLAAQAAWESFGGTFVHRQQLATRCAMNLFNAGDGWFVGTPPDVEEELRRDPSRPSPANGGGLIQGPSPVPADGTGGELDLATLTWRFLSTAEITFDASGGKVTLAISDADSGKWEGSPDQILAFRCWRPDPFEWWLADSPTLAALPILRKIINIGEAADAQLDSRLTGAGVFLVPQSADDAVRSQLGPQNGGEEPISPFMAAMMEAFEASRQDRDSAARMVPIAFTVPDQTVEKFKHLKFWTDLDAEYANLEPAQIGRLATSLDAPKELMTGVGGMNHWGAWLVQEDTVGAHVSPPAAIMADAFTTQFLWPILESQGMDRDVARSYVVWFSVDHLIVRANRFADAKDALTLGAINQSAFRQYGGFDDDDAPEAIDPPLQLALDMLRAAPTLAVSPGLPALVEQIRTAMAGEAPQPATADQAAAAEAPGGVPPESGGGTTGPPASEAPPAIAADGGLVLDTRGYDYLDRQPEEVPVP